MDWWHWENTEMQSSIIGDAFKHGRVCPAIDCSGKPTLAFASGNWESWRKETNSWQRPWKIVGTHRPWGRSDDNFEAISDLRQAGQSTFRFRKYRDVPSREAERGWRRKGSRNHIRGSGTSRTRRASITVGKFLIPIEEAPTQVSRLLPCCIGNRIISKPYKCSRR